MMVRDRALWLLAPLALATLVVACGDDGATEPEGIEGIGPNGGTVTSTDGNASVAIPAGALAQATSITVTVASNAPAGNVGSAYDFGPEGTTFAEPVTIQLSYGASSLPAGVVPADLVLARVVSGQWQAVAGSSIDTGTETVSGPATGFSIWGVVALTPSNVTAEAGDAAVELSWDAVEDAQSYNIYFKVNESGVTVDDEEIVGVTAESFMHEGLTNGSTYYYRVAAVKPSGEGSLSEEVSATPLPASPGAPQKLVAVPGDQQVSLSWDAVEGAESYNIYFKVNDDTGVTTADESIPVTSNSYVHEGLTNGSTYYYRVSAVSPLEIEGPLSDEASAALVVPAQPQGVEAVAGPFRVTVSWDAVEGATAYNVYWKSGTGGVTTSDAKIEVSGEATEVAHTGLEAGTPYFYIVTAANPVGEGTASSEVSATPTTASQAVMVAAGSGGFPPTTCAVMSDGTVRCVGTNPGDGTSSAAEPVAVTGISAATHVSVGSGHACAVEGGSVKCWGGGTAGQLGNGANLTELEPVTVSGITAATVVEAGEAFSCAIEGGDVKCWGAGTVGELGTAPVLESSPVPVVVPLPRAASQLSLGTVSSRACAILPDPDPQTDPQLDPELWCWGILPFWLGQNPTFCEFARCSPLRVPMVTPEWVSLGRDHGCWLEVLPGEVACGGSAAAQFFSPLDEPISFDRVSAGDDFNCGYTPAGTVTCWGFNGSGQLGDGTISPHPSYSYTHPVTAVGVDAATSISAGREHACAVDDGVVKCWGLGFGSTPVVVMGL